MSRVELAEKTGLSAQTLTNVTRRLTAEGFIAGEGREKWGRAPASPDDARAPNPRPASRSACTWTLR